MLIFIEMSKEYKYITDHLERLSIEQLHAVQARIDNLLAESIQLPDFTEAQERELERRYKDVQENPGHGVDWEGYMDAFEAKNGFRV